ncbi:MAG: PAS domain S-box protein [Geobacteraceae bacterium]|nr:PAS domain S-box protein [Geobacteraceae bacterium]
MQNPNPLQLFDIEQIQRLLEAHFTLTGILSAILDTEGNIIVAVGWQDICSRFHRTDPASRACCHESDTFINSHLHECKEGFLEYKCKNGLWDVALPIIIGGKHLATFFTGQFFYEDDTVDREWFHRKAEQHGFDVTEYLAALDRVPVFSRAQIKAAVAYYQSLVTLIADAGMTNLQLAQDMQERSRMEESLRESEATLRTITSAARDAIIMIDNRGKISFWNPAAEQMLGWQAPEALGTDLHLLLAPDSYHTEYHRGMDLFSSTGRGEAVGKTIELRARRKDTTEFPIELSLSAVQLGGHWHAVGIIRDISRRKANEEKLSLTSFMVDNISDGIEWISPEGRFLDVNEACCRSLGYSRDEMLALSVSDIDPTLTGTDWSRIWERIKRERERRIESLHKTRDGRLIPMDINYNFFRYGETEYLCAICRDISERKEAEQALQASEDRYRIFTAISSDYVFKCTRQGNEPYRIQWMAGPVKAITGYAEDEIFTMGCWKNIVHPDDAQRITTHLTQFSAGQKSTVQYRIVTKSGEVRWIRESSFCEAGKSPGELVLYGTSKDVTEQEILRDQLLKNQKLESLGVLAGGIAHDFNNILTGVMGNISFARMFLDTAHRASRPLEAAEKASKRAAELAQQLLTFAKGGAPLKKSIMVRPLVEECLSLVLRGTNVLGVMEFPEDLQAIEADEGQLGQVFNNILINAVQAMPGGGTITIRAENRSLDSGNSLGLPDGRYVQISFSDEGCGIKDEDLAKVFDPYYTTKTGGTGLGLTSAHSIISRHGGSVDVQTRIGEGTTFSFYLPSSEPGFADDLRDHIGRDATAGTGDNILVLDDEEMIRDLATEMLEHLGYRVTTCSRGEEAVALYRAACETGNPYSAVILDLTIPGSMGGKETAQSILMTDPHARLIVSSGYANDPVMADFRKYGFQAMLVKPYSSAEIARVLAY